MSRKLPLSILLFLLASPVFAGMFQIRDQNPLVLPYGLPMKAYAELPDNGQWRGFISYSRSRTTLQQGDPLGDEYLVVKGETARTDLMLFRGLERNWALGLHVPLISHEDQGLGGILGGSSSDFEGADGNPVGSDLAFLYRRDGEDLLSFSDGVSGIGDISCLLGYQWQRDGADRLALYLQFKFPTGDSDKLLGSGSIDYANWFTASTRLTDRWLINGDFGFSMLGNGEILPDQQRNFILFGGLGAEWVWRPKVRFKLQMDHHGSMFRKTNIQFFDKVLMLSGGMSLRLHKNYYADFAIVDDFFRGRSPDVTIHFALRYHPGGDFH